MDKGLDELTLTTNGTQLERNFAGEPGPRPASNA